MKPENNAVMFVCFFFCRNCLNTCRATWRMTVKYILDSSEVMHSMRVEFILIKSALLFCYSQCFPFHLHKASLWKLGLHCMFSGCLNCLMTRLLTFRSLTPSIELKCQSLSLLKNKIIRFTFIQHISTLRYHQTHDTGLDAVKYCDNCCHKKSIFIRFEVQGTFLNATGEMSESGLSLFRYFMIDFRMQPLRLSSRQYGMGDTSVVEISRFSLTVHCICVKKCAIWKSYANI